MDERKQNPDPPEEGTSKRDFRWRLKHFWPVWTTLGGVGVAVALFMHGMGSDESGVVATSTSQVPAVAATLQPTPERQLLSAPIENAFRTGKIELKGEGDWENYFTPVTQEEAAKLSAEANKAGKFRYIFPFDPTRSPNLTLETSKKSMRDDAAELTYTYVKVRVTNLAAGTVVVCAIGGAGGVGNEAIVRKDQNNRQVLVDMIPSVMGKDNWNFGVYLPLDATTAEGINVRTPLNKRQFKAGEMLATTSESLLAGGSSLIYEFSNGGTAGKRNSANFGGADLVNLLLKDGKIAFVAQN